MAKTTERQFKVKVIAISLKNNGIAKSKEIVVESQLAAPAHELLEGGYIELYEAVEGTETKKSLKAKSDDKLNDIDSAIPGSKDNSKK